jgi:3-methyl-2-oxobutanoate hydroxymethyltransferase
MVTAYDAAFASIAAAAGADWLLVGDSLGMVVQGKTTTREVTMDHMVYHTSMVRKGAPDAVIVSDLPFNSFSEPGMTVKNSRRLLEAGADAVKFEGAVMDSAIALREAGIPFMGHLGLLPQSAGKFTVQGKESDSAARMMEEAALLEEGGAFSIVLECIPRSLGRDITRALSIPTIGIGAGPDCSGQVLVLNDLLGLTEGYLPKFVRKYADFRSAALSAIAVYGDEVRSGVFPDDAHTYH